MTWPNRLRLVLGLLLVLTLTAVFTIVLNRRITQVTSASASIQALHLDIGTDYAGTVMTSSVEVGDDVAEGDTIVTVQSQALAHDIAIGLIRADAAPFGVTPDGTMTFVAPADGIVTALPAQEGAFVQAGTVLATLDRADSLYVSAEYSLDAGDYERIETGAAVSIVLPNQKEISGTVESVAVRTAADRAESVIKISSGELERGGQNGLIAPGVPVLASVALRDDGIMAGVEAAASTFLRKVTS